MSNRSVIPPTASLALPSSHDMERSVLSCMMQAPDYAVSKAQGILKAEHFHNPGHRILFSLMVQHSTEGSPVDVVSVMQTLMDRKQMEEAGGAAYVSEIYTFVPTPAHVAHYCEQVREKATLRQIVISAYDTLADVESNPESVQEVVSRFENRALALREEKATEELSMSGKAAAYATLDAIEQQMAGQKPAGVPFGIKTLDEITGGICPGLTIIGAETSGGKSILAAQATIAMMRAGLHVDYYSLEMPIDLCVRRMVAHIGKLQFSRIRNPIPEFNSGEHSDFRAAFSEFVGLSDRLWICADGAKTAEQIMMETRRKVAAGIKVGGVVVDYIQRLSPKDPKATSEQQITDASRCLKRLADALNIPVITPVQLNDQGLVRGSRMLGMDADLYVKIQHLKGDDGEPSEPDEHGRRECLLYVEKNRNGERWKGVPSLMDGAKMRFTEKAPHEHQSQNPQKAYRSPIAR